MLVNLLPYLVLKNEIPALEVPFLHTESAVKLGQLGDIIIGLSLATGALLLSAVYQPAGAVLLVDFTGEISSAQSAGNESRPNAVSVDPVSGEICVTNSGLSSIQVFHPRGVLSFQTSAISRIAVPMDASIDAAGGFFFTDSDASGGRSIRHLNFLGEPLPFAPESPTDNWHPTHLILTRDGGIVTLDENSELLVKHDAVTGALIWRSPIAQPNADAGADLELVLGRPAEAPDGRIYVPGGALHLVLVFGADGARSGNFGRFGTGTGRFVFPNGLAFGPDGEIFVLDRLRHVVLHFDAEHRFVSEFGHFGQGVGELYHPLAIATSASGGLYLAQGYMGRVQGYQMIDTQKVERGRGGGLSDQSVTHPSVGAVGRAGRVLRLASSVRGEQRGGLVFVREVPGSTVTNATLLNRLYHFTRDEVVI